MEDQTRAPESYLDPQMKEFIAYTASMAAKFGNTFELTINEARAAIEEAQRPAAEGGPVMFESRDRWIDIGGRRMLVRHHKPTDESGTPVMLFFHGGGWTWNSIDTHDRVAREYASRTGYSVMMVDYAMAPEYPFPIPVLESAQAIEWFIRHGEKWGVDGTRMAVGGDSAGANLALAATMILREEGKPLPKAMLLNYGAFDDDLTRQSFEWIGNSTLSPQTWKIKWFLKNYLQTDTCDDWRALPLKGSLANLPPARVQVGQLDVLRDENIALAEAIRAAGGEAECVVYPGVTHGFLRAVGRVDVADQAIQQGSEWMMAKLG